MGGISVRGSIPAMYRAKPRTTSSRIHGTTLPGGTFGLERPGERQLDRDELGADRVEVSGEAPQ